MTWESFTGLASDKLADLTFKAADAFGGKEIAKINADTNKATVTGPDGANSPVGAGMGAGMAGLKSSLASVPVVVWIGGAGITLALIYLARRK